MYKTGEMVRYQNKNLLIEEIFDDGGVFLSDEDGEQYEAELKDLEKLEVKT